MKYDFLLNTSEATELYSEFAAGLPIYDCHSHLPPEQIAADTHFADITELWLGGDHYKWRAMRTDGVDERCITGRAAPFEKFCVWAKTLPRLLGNPLYLWSELELSTYFGINEPLTPENCLQIWNRCNERLGELSARKLLKMSGVKLVYTTDDPADTLEHHLAFAKSGESFRMLPAWRPDRACRIERPDFGEYIKKLSAAANTDIVDFNSLTDALLKRMEHFHSVGCRNSDHGLARAVFARGDADAPLKKALSGKPVTPQEADVFLTELMLFLAGEYSRRGWAMQLHFGAVRDLNPAMYSALGSDTGFDAAGAPLDISALGAFLGELTKSASLPKTVVYSIDPGDNIRIGTLIGCFQGGMRGRMQQGCAWWFNDSRRGILDMLESLGNLSVLPDFIGMVTDSRSFLSFARHDWFRRLLCNYIGGAVSRGEYPLDRTAIKTIITDISYKNAAAFFGAEE